MKETHNCTKAKLITLVVVLVAILIGSGRSMWAAYHYVENAFSENEGGAELTIQYNLDTIAENCYNLTTVAKRYMDANDPLITRVLQSSSALKQAEMPADKYAAKQELLDATQALYQQLGTLELSASDIRYRNGWMAAVEASERAIAFCDYNQIAQAYNHKMGQFPANLLRIVTFVPKAELFQ